MFINSRRIYQSLFTCLLLFCVLEIVGNEQEFDCQVKIVVYWSTILYFFLRNKKIMKSLNLLGFVRNYTQKIFQSLVLSSQRLSGDIENPYVHVCLLKYWAQIMRKFVVKNKLRKFMWGGNVMLSPHYPLYHWRVRTSWPSLLCVALWKEFFSKCSMDANICRLLCIS